MRYFIIVLAMALYACGTQKLQEGLDMAQSVLSDVSGNPAAEATPKLTEGEVIKGLKNALEVGINKSSSMLSKENGFLSDAEVFIPFPKEAIAVKEKLSDIGFTKPIEDFERSLNRAAEKAVSSSLPIFMKAISEMTIQDGFQILKGDTHAATNFFKEKTYNSLVETFKPIARSAIGEVGVTRYWEPIVTKYNAVMFFAGKEAINPDLEAYVTERAIDGLFLKISKEEEKIRENPIHRTTEILQKVFGWVF